MTQKFDPISPSEKVSSSLEKLKNRDVTSATMFSGTDFPEDLTDEMVGTWCDRTDVKTVYRLESVTPNVVWKAIFNYEDRVPTKEEVDKDYQPLNKNLTALSQLTATSNSIPYFQTVSTNSVVMANLQMTSYSMNFVQKQNVSEVREALGLGELSVQDTVNGSQIDDGTITQDKLGFNVSSAGYDTGDFLETIATKTLDDGWVLMRDGTIGDSQSGATDCADDRCENLFKNYWKNTNLKIYNGDGTLGTRTSPEEDWADHKRLELPKVLGRILTGTAVKNEIGRTYELSVSDGTDRGFAYQRVKIYARL